MNTTEIGRLGESAVCSWLKAHGYHIVRNNFCIRGGEIDIISEKDGIIAFTEVKTRAPDPLVNGLEAITPSKRKLIIKTSEQYSIRYPHDDQPRFDAACVTVLNGKVIDFQYIENAFDASE